MKVLISISFCLILVCLTNFSSPAPAQEKPKREKFASLAYLPSGAGRAMVGAGARANVDIYINRYSTDEEAKAMAAALIDGGSDSLLKALEKSKSIGKITLTGRVGFYDLKLIRSRPSSTGRTIYAVGDRPMGFLELYYSGRSRDYEFGILQLDLKKNSKGKEEGVGALIYAAKIKLLEGNTIDIENYGIDPVRLLGVRKL
jgi:hypothetical protein